MKSKERKNSRENESGRKIQDNAVKVVVVVRACTERGRICG